MYVHNITVNLRFDCLYLTWAIVIRVEEIEETEEIRMGSRLSGTRQRIKPPKGFNSLLEPGIWRNKRKGRVN
jgi:hypothetical protein